MTKANLDNLVCGKCGREYILRKKNGTRGPVAFECEVCGEQIFLWVFDENEDYDFELVGIGICLKPNNEELDRIAGWKTGVYGNRTHWELCSNPPLVLKTRAPTRGANTPKIENLPQVSVFEAVAALVDK